MKPRKRNRIRDRQRADARRIRLKAVGLCECTAPVVPGRTLCQSCADGNRRRNHAAYERARANGLCGRCLKRQAVVGITRCEECSSWQSARISGHGATLELRRRLFFEQGGKCAICVRDLKDPVGANVDHCHRTKRIRGLLCARCNKAIGWFGDNHQLIQCAAEYLRRNLGEEVA